MHVLQAAFAVGLRDEAEQLLAGLVPRRGQVGEGVELGQPATKTFTADKTGSFEIEIEDSSTRLGELEVQPR